MTHAVRRQSQNGSGRRSNWCAQDRGRLSQLEAVADDGAARGQAASAHEAWVVCALLWLGPAVIVIRAIVRRFDGFQPKLVDAVGIDYAAALMGQPRAGHTVAVHQPIADG